MVAAIEGSMTMKAESEPRHLSRALSELFALRGLARVRGDAQLADVWTEVAGEAIATQTRVQGIKRGVLNVGVSNSALLSELAAFHKLNLIESLHERRPDLQIRDLKFRLNGQLGIGK
jgi:predicted nucleic acid-binding Zn ribbon protein